MLAEARLMEATLLGSNPAATSRDHRHVVTTHRRPRPCGAAAAGPAGRRRLRSDVGRAARATRPYTFTTNPGRQKDQSAPELAAAAVGGVDQRMKMPGSAPGGGGCCSARSGGGSARGGGGATRGGFRHSSALLAVAAGSDESVLGAGAPAAAAVWARLLPGTEAAAEEEAEQSFLAVMERTSFGPALWAIAPLEEVGRLSVGSGELSG